MRTHRFEPVSLVFGVVFAGLGLWFLAGDVDVWQVSWRWVWPTLLLGSGAVVLLSGRSRRDSQDPEESGVPE